MTELTWGGLIFFAVIVIDLAYVAFKWLNRIPKVEGFTVDEFVRNEASFWRHENSYWEAFAEFRPMKFVDSTVNKHSFSVEICVRSKKAKFPDEIRVWLDGVQYGLARQEVETVEGRYPYQTYYSSLLDQSDRWLERHDPIIERFN